MHEALRIIDNFINAQVELLKNNAKLENPNGSFSALSPGDAEELLKLRLLVQIRDEFSNYM